MIPVTLNGIGKLEIGFQEILERKKKVIGYMELLELTGKCEGKNPEIWVVFSVISSHLYPLRPTYVLHNSILSQFMYFLCNIIQIPIMFLPFFPCSFCLTAEWSLSNSYSTSMSKPQVSFVIIFLCQIFCLFVCFSLSKCPLMPSDMLWLSVHKPEFLEPDIQHIHSSCKKIKSHGSFKWFFSSPLLFFCF